MPTITVITAVDPARSEHLPKAYASLLDQDFPATIERETKLHKIEQRPDGSRAGYYDVHTNPEQWDFEWLVQCDSLDEIAQNAVRSLLPDDPRISFGANRQGGPGIARTMALARATGALVKVLDADDELTPGVLARDITACLTPEVGWSASRVMDMHPDGTLTDHRPDLPRDGQLRIGDVGLYWRQHEWGIWVHPATLCARRGLVVALGGWMALPASEDTGLLMALDAVSAGWFHDTVGLHYRRWAPQMSASAAHADPVEREARRTLITERLDALPALIDSW